jgi:tetratricopeptide (TPR) repeat protein
VQFYVKQGEIGSAVKLCQERIQKDPKDAGVHNLLGRVYMADKKFAEAEDSFQKAMDLNPNWPQPYENMASLYIMQGQRTKAIERFEALLKKQPDAVKAYLSLGLLYEMGQEYPKAIQAYEKALEKDPRFWTAANNLAFLLTEKGAGEADLKKALKLALDVHKLQGDRPEISDTLGWVYFKMGDMERAAEFLEKAASVATPSPVVSYHLGMLRLKQGRIDEAKAKLQEALAGKTTFLGKEDAEAALGKM